jgi:hypothetical protein
VWRTTTGNWTKTPSTNTNKQTNTNKEAQRNTNKQTSERKPQEGRGTGSALRTSSLAARGAALALALLLAAQQATSNKQQAS